MKLISIISAIMSIVATAISASAQTDYKFGKVTRAELERTDYPAMVDGADAVVLDELSDLLLSTDKTYPQNERYYNVDRIVTRKIKILKPEGLSQATVSICEDDHIFTEHYTSDYLFRNIAEAETKGVDLLVGGACGYGTGVPIGDDLFWTDWYWGNQFLIIRKNIYSRILDFNFRDGNTADGVLSGLIRRKAILHPFVSVQREFGYSDITPTNGRKGFINDLFDDTARRLQSVRDITDEFNCRR